MSADRWGSRKGGIKDGTQVQLGCGWRGAGDRGGTNSGGTQSDLGALQGSLSRESPASNSEYSQCLPWSCSSQGHQVAHTLRYKAFFTSHSSCWLPG